MINCLSCHRPLVTVCNIDPCPAQRRLDAHSLENLRNQPTREELLAEHRLAKGQDILDEERHERALEWAEVGQ